MIYISYFTKNDKNKIFTRNIKNGATKHVYPIAEFIDVLRLSGFTSGMRSSSPAKIIEYNTANTDTHIKIQAGTKTT